MKKNKDEDCTTEHKEEMYEREQAQNLHSIQEQLMKANGECEPEKLPEGIRVWGEQEMGILTNGGIQEEESNWRDDIHIGPIDYAQREAETPWNQQDNSIYNDLSEIVNDIDAARMETDYDIPNDPIVVKLCNILSKLQRNIDNQCYICKNPME